MMSYIYIRLDVSYACNYLTDPLNSVLGDLMQSIVVQILPNFDHIRDCNYYRCECMIQNKDTLPNPNPIYR